MPNKALGSASSKQSISGNSSTSTSSHRINGRSHSKTTKVGQGRINGDNMPGTTSTANRGYRIAEQQRPPSSAYQLRLTLRFIILTVFGTAALAFLTGRLAVAVVLFKQKQDYGIFKNSHKMLNGGAASDLSIPPHDTKTGGASLPLPTYSELKEVPHTIYSSKNFDTGVDATSDSVLARRKEGFVARPIVAHSENGESMPQQHEPAGQHLLIDIKFVNGAFLNSKDRLASAMVDLVNISGLTMLSYHCHALVPVGVSCVGVLLESHISFHTWPGAGVITLDLFTCGPKSLLPLLSVIKELFGVPRVPDVPGAMVETPFMQWVHKNRGFRIHQDTNPDEVDLNQFLLGWFEYDYKELIVSKETDYQLVEIYDVISRRMRDLAGYEKSLADPNSYEGRNKDLFRPDRILFLDGIKQSRFHGDAAYHEALVHPIMFSHDNPKRVAIIGGGEGATLREVLKHGTLEKVVMVEIDEEMVNLSRQYLPEWSDCSNLPGSTKSCFEHPKAEVYYTDAIAWFMERFGDKETLDPTLRFDIIIMDALDPDSAVSFSDVLYNNEQFAQALSNALTDEGALVAQLGEAGSLASPGLEYTKLKYTKIFVERLQHHGLAKFTTYEESSCGFMAPWTFMVAFKDWYGFLNWNDNEARVNKNIARRVVRTVDGQIPLRYFDGATMSSYQHPSRMMETMHCRDDPQPEECASQHGYDPERPDAKATMFEVKPSTIPNAGRGLFAKIDIPMGATLALEESIHCMMVPPRTVDVIDDMSKSKSLDAWSPFDPYFFGYGFSFEAFGDAGYSIDPGLMTFMNHGCNNTNNVGVAMSVTELTADPDRLPEELSHFPPEISSPFFARNYYYKSNLGSTRRDIKAGEEILDNFLYYYMDTNWKRGVMDLRSQCSSSQSLGAVSSYEVQVE